MKQHKPYLFVSLLAVVALTTLISSMSCNSCRRSPEGASTGQSVTTEPTLEPIVPAGYKKIAPAPVDDSRQMLTQTGAVFRGALKDVRFSYDACAGPRTDYGFSDVSPLAGEKLEAQVTVKVLGGPTPRGTWLSVSELPKLALDSEYVVFLRNTDWTYSPIVGDLVFRVETVAGREVLVNPEGRAVTGWGEDGPRLTAGKVSEAVGSQVHGYRRADAGDRGDTAPSNETDAKGEAHLATEVAPGQPATQGRAPDVTMVRAPSAAKIRASGMFARPAISAAAVANEQTIPVNALVATIKDSAERDRIQIGGRVALDPNWKCWSSTPTLKAKR